MEWHDSASVWFRIEIDAMTTAALVKDKPFSLQYFDYILRGQYRRFRRAQRGAGSQTCRCRQSPAQHACAYSPNRPARHWGHRICLFKRATVSHATGQRGYSNSVSTLKLRPQDNSICQVRQKLASHFAVAEHDVFLAGQAFQSDRSAGVKFVS